MPGIKKSNIEVNLFLTITRNITPSADKWKRLHVKNVTAYKSK
jgi:hypothetical protein